MNGDADRIRHDLNTIETALGLNIWTRRDVRRGFLGVLAGGLAGLFLVLWGAFGGELVTGLSMFLVMLGAILMAKDFGYKRNPAPATGSNREVAHYQRFYLVGSVLIGCFFIWGQRLGVDLRVLLACAVVMAGLWYSLYAVSDRSREISLGGAIPLTLCGFLIPEASSLAEAIGWIGYATCVGCWVEAALLFMALRSPARSSGSRPPGSTPPDSQQPDFAPQSPLPPSGHAAHPAH